jgi:hypothetical protein
MKSLSLIIVGLLVLVLASSGYSQSLAELAKKEKARREAVKANAKVLTNEQANQGKARVSTTTLPPATEKLGTDKTAAGAEKAAEDAAAKEKPATDEPVDFQGRPESFWRQTFADARKKVSDLENEATAIVLKLNDLQNRFYRESDGFKQQDIQREIQKTIYEQDLNKHNLTLAKEALEDLEKEARKSGALPGWIK